MSYQDPKPIQDQAVMEEAVAGDVEAGLVEEVEEVPVAGIKEEEEGDLPEAIQTQDL